MNCSRCSKRSARRGDVDATHAAQAAYAAPSQDVASSSEQDEQLPATAARPRADEVDATTVLRRSRARRLQRSRSSRSRWPPRHRSEGGRLDGDRVVLDSSHVPERLQRRVPGLGPSPDARVVARADRVSSTRVRAASRIHSVTPKILMSSCRTRLASVRFSSLARATIAFFNSGLTQV